MRVRQYLGLFDPGTRVRLRVGAVFAGMIAGLDVLGLLLLLPVFSDIASSGTDPSVGGAFAGLRVELLLGMAVGVLVTRAAADFALRAWWAACSARAEAVLADRVMRAYAYAPYSFHRRTNSSELLSRAISHVGLTTAGLDSLMILTADLLTVGGIGAALIALDPVAGLAVGGYLLLVGSMFAMVTRRSIRRRTHAYNRNVSDVYTKGAVLLRGIRELTVSGGRPQALDEVAATRNALVRARSRLQIVEYLPAMLLSTALYLSMLIAILFVLSSQTPETTIPIVAIYLAAGIRILPSMARLLVTVTRLRTAIGMGERVIADLSDLEEARPAPSAPRTPEAHAGSRETLHLRDVTFGFADDEAILHQLEASIPFGSLVVVQGQSGVGKSTLLALMMGLLEPTSGTIDWGATDIHEVGEAWFGHVAFVPQETYVLDDSLLANVALGDRDPSRVEAMRAIEAASLGPTVGAFEMGLDEQLGEDGARLSEGQKQRLGVARALYRQALVLLLDEPTASLDAGNARSVMETIRKLRGLATVILVTHDPADAEDADIVIDLDAGSIVER